jgi:hypothetical protein
MTLAIFPEGTETMPPGEGEEKLALPGIGQAELELNGSLRDGGELGFEALERAGGGIDFSGKRAAIEEGFDFADFGDDFFAGH